MAEFEDAIHATLDNNPRLARRGEQLVEMLFKEAALVMQHGTTSAKTNLIARALAASISHAAQSTAEAQMEDLRREWSDFREKIFEDIPGVGSTPLRAPTDGQ